MFKAVSKAGSGERELRLATTTTQSVPGKQHCRSIPVPQPSITHHLPSQALQHFENIFLWFLLVENA